VNHFTFEGVLGDFGKKNILQANACKKKIPAQDSGTKKKFMREK